MATLIRRNNLYDQVPGMSQPLPVTSTTVNPNPNSTATTYQSNNPVLGYLAGGSSFLAPHPFTDAATSSRLQNTDTALFGQLAGLIGPNLRFAQTLSLNDIYGSGGTSFGEVGGVGVNVRIDPDLPNKQAETGTVAWYRKVAQDLTPTDFNEVYKSYQSLANTNPSLAKALNTPNIQLASIKSSISSPYGTYQGSTGMPKVSSTVLSSWNKPNQNIFGGYGVQTFRSNERLAPSSISQGRGLIQGPTISIRPSSTFRWIK